ncbi:uncharacterized protein LOC133902926 [Phragmites australis]|uniref:uncharacterized protein LOC133902926 n=1 Tax=Phragmites australis TaxID=29695 RepID=UPI002D79E2B3|nr:uncharacterized protein LOC133902926 [Phragmites australis]
MTPDWVLLDRFVDFCFEEEVDEAAVAAVAAAVKNKGAAPTLQSLREKRIALLGSLKPDTLFPPPPGIATFRLRCPKSHGDDVARLACSSLVACADKSLVVLYGGRYSGAGSSGPGCYLIYDTAATGNSNSILSTVPRLPLFNLIGIGYGAVVLRRHSPRADATTSSYLLAELAAIPRRGLPDAELYLWWSDAPTAQWDKKAVRLPREVSREPGKHLFSIDASFSFGTSSLCWVDLLLGIVVCADPGQQDPHFRFIPLPNGCPAVGTSEKPDRPRMHEFRYVGCVGGVIKLVATEGLLEGWDFHKFRLVTWTLSPDLSEWKKDAVFPLKDLWASDDFLSLKLPQHTPVCPVLSARDDGVVYAIVNHVEKHSIVKGSEVVQTKVEIKGQCVLELDMQRNKIISTSVSHPTSLAHLIPGLIATDFTAYLQGAKDRQREVEASEVGEGERG